MDSDREEAKPAARESAKIDETGHSKRRKRGRCAGGLTYLTQANRRGEGLPEWSSSGKFREFGGGMN
jgi:hypothetical protein